MTTRHSNAPRVLILNHNLVEHGTYFRAIKVAEVLRDRGAAVTFVCSGNGKYRAQSGQRRGMRFLLTPHWSPIHSPDAGWSPLGLLWRFRLATSRKWDLVYSFSHHPICWLPGRLAANESECPIILDWCDLYGSGGLHSLGGDDLARRCVFSRAWCLAKTDKIEEKLELKAAREADIVTPIGSYLSRMAIDVAGAEPQRVHLMPSGAELDRIRPQDQAACRDRFSVPREVPVLSYVANFNPDEKLLLKALGLVHRRRPEVRMLSCGNGFYGGEQALRRHGIDKMVTHLGRLPFDEIQHVLGAADVCLTPMTKTVFNTSRWPNKICDYLAAGRPQVVCAVGDAIDFFESRNAGLLCEPTAEDFAAKILQLLDDREARLRMGIEARRIAEEELDWARITDGVIRRLLALDPKARKRLGSLVR